jgi:FdhD protein
MVARLSAGERQLRPDRLVVEEPLEIRLDDHLITTTMRTPGHDYELAAGFCFTEGLLAGAPVTSVRYCATGPASASGYNVVTVSTGGLAPEPAARLRPTTSSCGVCGSASLDQLADRLSPLPGPSAVVDLDALARAAAEARRRQALFEETGAIHAASLFDPAIGDVLLVREDIGRHNAVDKVVGRLLLDGGLPAPGAGLLVSGRASFEIVQKAWAAGIGLVAAVSGPSSLAVETARRAGIALVGFLRPASANLYAPGGEEVEAAGRLGATFP